MRETQRRYNQDVSIKDIYEYYAQMYFKEKFIKKDGTVSKKSIVHKNSKYNVIIKTYNNIIKDYHELMCDDILKGKDFTIFERLGVIGIRKNKIKIKVKDNGEVETNAPIDFKSTMELWADNKEAKEKKILIRHINIHTKKYIHRWYWDKNHANFRNKTAYSFIPSRKNKRNLAQVLKDEDSEVDFYTRYSRTKKF
jgi:hypothetical protein